MQIRKADKILICVLMLVSLALMIPLFQGSWQPAVAVVKVRSEEVLRIDLSVDGTYTVDGSNGPVTINVKNGAVAVTQENSPHHYCSLQGYVSSSNTPIVCLPNETVVLIEGRDGSEDVIVS